jgi:hypothetical protein
MQQQQPVMLYFKNVPDQHTKGWQAKYTTVSRSVMSTPRPDVFLVVYRIIARVQKKCTGKSLAAQLNNANKAPPSFGESTSYSAW